MYTHDQQTLPDRPLLSRESTFLSLNTILSCLQNVIPRHPRAGCARWSLASSPSCVFLRWGHVMFLSHCGVDFGCVVITVLDGQLFWFPFRPLLINSLLMSYKAAMPWVCQYARQMLTHGFPTQVDPDVPVSCWCVTKYPRLSAVVLPLISSRGRLG